jgi:hypothetical protein
MARKPVTKGGPRPEIKDYTNLPNGQALFDADVAEWQRLNVGPPSVSSPSTQSGGSVVPTNELEPDTAVTGSNVRTDFTAFDPVKGIFVYNDGDPAVGQSPYVTAPDPYGSDNPTPVVILPSSDKKGYIVITREELLNTLVKSISRDKNSILALKMKLQLYYKSKKDYEVSLRGGPVTDKDTGFLEALKNALGEISANNLSTAQENLSANILDASGFYDFNTWIEAREIPSPVQRTSQSTRNFTKKADAIADFMREVQIQVGDPKLVNNVDALAEAYWQKIRKTELDRMSRSTSTYDPLTGLGATFGTGFQLPSAQLLKEWRVEFITKGAIDKEKVISTGIRNVAPIDLQDAGGEIGDNYTKLKGYANSYGVRLTDEQLKTKAAEASLPGGSIEEQQKTIQLASRALYKSLAPFIEGGLKVGDIAGQFMKAKTSELELSEGEVDIFDSDVQSALSGDKLPGSLDYLMQVRSDPRYRFTKKANESAAGFLDTLLRMWGKVG